MPAERSAAQGREDLDAEGFGYWPQEAQDAILRRDAEIAQLRKALREKGVRTDAREAEGSGLLSRPAGNSRVGSNPTPSASRLEPEDKRGGSSSRRDLAKPPGSSGRPDPTDACATGSSAATRDDGWAEIERRHPLGFSRSLNPIRSELVVALNGLPKDGFVMSREAVERIAEALGGWQKLNEVIHGE